MTEPAFLLDTNICIYALTGASDPLRGRMAMQPRASLAISTISLAELSVGYGETVFEAPDLNAFLAVVRPIAFDDVAAKIYGTLPFRRSRLDRLIAAHALALDMTLVTNNEADFADVPGLKLENWTLPL